MKRGGGGGGSEREAKLPARVSCFANKEEEERGSRANNILSMSIENNKTNNLPSKEPDCYSKPGKISLSSSKVSINADFIVLRWNF